MVVVLDVGAAPPEPEFFARGLIWASPGKNDVGIVLCAA